MKRDVLKIVTLMLAILAIGSVAHAQGQFFATMEFKFTAGGKSHDAGRYKFEVSADQRTVTISPASGGVGSMVQVVTDIARPETGTSEGRVVFAKVGTTYYLEDIWLPGEDGLLIYTAKQKHAHERVPLQKG